MVTCVFMCIIYLHCPLSFFQVENKNKGETDSISHGELQYLPRIIVYSITLCRKRKTLKSQLWTNKDEQDGDHPEAQDHGVKFHTPQPTLTFGHATEKSHVSTGGVHTGDVTVEPLEGSVQQAL